MTCVQVKLKLLRWASERSRNDEFKPSVRLPNLGAWICGEARAACGPCTAVGPSSCSKVRFAFDELQGGATR
jgi:hypothetical protein